MAEKNPISDNPELPLNEDNEILKPPPRRKKSMKKSVIEAEKARQKQLERSVVCSENNAKLTANCQDVKAQGNTKSNVGIPESNGHNIETQQADEPVTIVQSECEMASKTEPNSTNKMQINDSKVEKQPGYSEGNKMATEQSLSTDEKRNLSTSQMGNKHPKCNVQNTTEVSNETEVEIISNHSQTNQIHNGDENVTNNEIESFCWVDNKSSISTCIHSNDKDSKCSTDVSKQPNVTKSDVGNSATEQNMLLQRDNSQISSAEGNSKSVEKSRDLDESSSTTSVQNSSTDTQIAIQSSSGSGHGNTQLKDIKHLPASESTAFSISESNVCNKEFSKESQLLTKSQSLTKVDSNSESKRSGSSDSLLNINNNSTSGVVTKQELNPVDLNKNTIEKRESGSLIPKGDDLTEKNSDLQPNSLESDEMHPTMKGETSLENNKHGPPSSTIDTTQQISSNTSTVKDCSNLEKDGDNSTNDNNEAANNSKPSKETNHQKKLLTASPNKEKHSLPNKEINNRIDNTPCAGAEAQTIEDPRAKSPTTSKNKGKHSPRKNNSFAYQHLGDSLSSVEEYELWEEENISTDSDSDIFYSDYSSSGDEGEYNLELREKLCGTHKIDGSLGDSLPRSPSGENTISQILAVFPNTEYLSVTDGKDADRHGNVNHNDSPTNHSQEGSNTDDIELSNERAASLKRKIGSFKIVPGTEQKVDTDAVKEAAVAIPTKSNNQLSPTATNADEAEKAIQVLHKNYMKHVLRDIKSKPRKPTEKEGESTVYFSRVHSSEQDDTRNNAIPLNEKKLEISRPRSIHGEPRLRSLSTGDLTNTQQLGTENKRFTLPVRGRTRSWKNENEERLVLLNGELRYIIGSLGNLELSRERRDSGTPLYKTGNGRALEKVPEVKSDETTKDGPKDGSKLELEKEGKSDKALEESAPVNKIMDQEESELNEDLIPRTLSVVQEELASIPKPNSGSSASSEEKSKDANKIDSEGKDATAAPLEGATPSTKGTLVRFKDEIDAPLKESTPKRPRSLDLSEVFSDLDESSIDASESDNSRLGTPIHEKTSSKSSEKKSTKNGDVETRKIKMSKGRRPFSSIEPRNIPTSPTDDYVQLRGFHSTSDADSIDAVLDDSKIDADVEVAEEANEEITPTRPPRRKPPLNASASFYIPSRETPVKRAKNKNRPEKSFRKTLSDADWLKVRLSMVKPLPELAHDGPVTLVTDALPASIPNFPTYKRAQIALELYTTERTYVRGLETVIELFKTPLEGYLDTKEMETMFSNINSIFTLNKDALFSLCERVTHWSDDQMIGDIFADMAPRFKIYATYCTNYDAAETLIKQKIKRKKDFEAFLNTCYNDPICQPGLTLQAYLITVVQRIPRYLLLLRDLEKSTPSDHVDYKTVKEGLQKMNNIAEYINNQLQAVQGQRAMTELRSRVIGIKAFETPGRSLIKEGEVYLMSTKRTYKCLLFNDMIVFAAKNVNKHSEVELTLELKTLWVSDLDDNDPQTSKEDALELYTPERSYTMYAGSRNEKKLWLQKLKTSIAIQLLGEEATESSEISSRKAAFTFKDGRIYCGCFVDSKTHGNGVLAWPNRTRYVGNFEDGERNGIGELTYSTGEKYNGQWVDDKQHGIGKLTYPNGDFYCGEWKQGKMHGKGLITFSNNDKIEGQFDNSEVCGAAKLHCSNGLLYDGTWKNSKKHGKGKLTKPNGDIYEGEFQNDRIHGMGTMVYAKTKATYKGQWENNQRHGIGSYSMPNGSTYEGEWSADHIQGRGKMVYSNGEVYEGSWFRDMRFGKGLFKSHEGVYDGHFEYNLRHKFGVMEYNDGSRYEGEWQNDQREGQGVMIYADSGIYDGSWFRNLRHGRGKMTYPKGATYEGSWDLDSPHGSEGIYSDQDSNYTYVGEWVHGRKEGRGIERTPNGTYEGDFKANVRHGKGVETLKGGIVFEGKWRDNRKVGEGQRRTRWGSTETTEIQQWKEGQLMNKDESVAPDLPFVQRH